MKLDIVKTGINGEGIGYIDRKPVFVDGAFPQETVEVKITEKNERYQKAEVVKILSKSKHRIRSGCSVSRRCGACPFITMDYTEQCKTKQQLLSEALWKYAKVPSSLIRDLKPSADVFGYRNQCKLPVAMEHGKLVSGMYASGTNHLVPIQNCSLHDPKLEEIRAQVLAVLNSYHIKAYENGHGLRYLIMRTIQNQTQISLITGKDTLPQEMIDELFNIDSVVSVAQSVNTIKKNRSLFGTDSKILAGEETLPITIHGIQLFLSPESFFQLNVPQAEKLYSLAVSKVNPGDELVEAYCGVGAMSLMAKDIAKRVTGIEIIPQAIKNANHAVEVNRVPNVKFFCDDSADALEKIVRQKHVDTLLLDPPRAGLDDKMLDVIMNSDISKIIYVSCNPATLGKNLAVLKKKYDIRTVVPFDLFPNTPHVESITVLQRRGTTDRMPKKKNR